jgi:uroporphyrinogen decarboxylase
MPAELSHRERVLRAVEHKDLDRLPCFFRAEKVVADRLKKKYRLKNDLDLISHFGADALHISVPYRKEWLKAGDDEHFFYDMFGNKRQSVQYGHISSETVVEPVLAGATEADDIFGIKWPGRSMVDIDQSMEQAKKAHATGLAVYGGVWASIFTHSREMMGEEKYLLSMVENPQLISTLVERITDCFMEMNEVYLSACGSYLDLYYFGSDFGTQNSMFISREMFQRFYKPQLKRLADQAKSFGLKVMFHTCGAVSGIIPDLIECGVDVLDPVQVSTSGMSPESLAPAFKGEIAFHGGISTQTTLPCKSPEEIRLEIIDTIETLGPSGYIAAPDQDMLGDIPAENIEAMYNTLKEYKL